MANWKNLKNTLGSIAGKLRPAAAKQSEKQAGFAFNAVTDKTFLQVVTGSTETVLVVAGSPKTPQMDAFMKTIKALKARLPNLTVVTADPAHAPVSLYELRIHSTPSVVCFRKGGHRVAEMLIGQPTTEGLENYLRRNQLL